MIEEFKEWSEKLRHVGVKFKYDDPYSVWLSWSMSISLVPAPILRASIRYFKDKIRMEEENTHEKARKENSSSS